MNEVLIKDKIFEPYLMQQRIEARITELAKQINRDFKNERVLFIPVLNGSFMFFSDLMKQVVIDCEIQFVKYASYLGTESTGKVICQLPNTARTKGETVIVVEDIVDTGRTMKQIIRDLTEQEAKQIKICSLLLKPGRYDFTHTIDYTGFEIDDDFVVGYGLDYDGAGRNLQHIYKLKD